MINYRNLHKWLIRHHGKAKKCERCKKSGLKYEWALKKGRAYSKEIKDYRQLCHACHQKYDLASIERKCRGCKKTYNIKAWWQKYCTNSCRKRYYKEKLAIYAKEYRRKNRKKLIEYNREYRRLQKNST